MTARTLMLGLACACALALPAFAADDISGLYKRPNGNLVKIEACDQGFCVTSEMPATKDRRVGELTPDGSGNYTGSLTDLKSGKEYQGKASFDGKVLSVAGCVLGGLVCKSENWLQLR